MQAFTQHRGVVAPLDRRDVDTDAIIPKQFMKSIRRTGFGPHLFDAMRYLDYGEPGQDVSRRQLNPDFVLNRPRYRGASILLARANFGCGSSREHAPWAIAQYGFRVLLAPSFADIFYGNCLKNGILPIVLPEATIDSLFHEVAYQPGYELTVNLVHQTIIQPCGATLGFDIDPFRKYCLLNGFDDIRLTLQHEQEIHAFEARRLAHLPWLKKRAGD